VEQVPNVPVFHDAASVHVSVTVFFDWSHFDLPVAFLLLTFKHELPVRVRFFDLHVLHAPYDHSYVSFAGHAACVHARVSAFAEPHLNDVALAFCPFLFVTQHSFFRRVSTPVPHVTSHSYSVYAHSYMQPVVAEHVCSVSGALASQSNTDAVFTPSLHSTDRFCLPSPHVDEHGDQVPTFQSAFDTGGVEVVPHGSSTVFSFWSHIAYFDCFFGLRW
jgi:hypothetical protein